MKNIILGILIIILVLLTSCKSDKNPQGIMGGVNFIEKETLSNHYNIVMIDGCEYIYISAYSGNAGAGFLSHKGNCKNPIHICKCND